MTKKPAKKAGRKVPDVASKVKAESDAVKARPLQPHSDVTLKVVRLPHGHDLPLPSYQTEQAAGLDLLAAVTWDQPVTLLPGSRTLVPTGLSIEVPSGYEAQVRPRSGLALKSGLTVLNSPGTIDADYRGEVGVILANLSGVPFEIRRGERIAQLVVAPVSRVALIEVDALSDTDRGAGGFGSTGKEGAKTAAGETPPAKARKPKPKPKKSAAKVAKKPRPAKSKPAKKLPRK